MNAQTEIERMLNENHSCLCDAAMRLNKWSIENDIGLFFTTDGIGNDCIYLEEKFLIQLANADPKNRVSMMLENLQETARIEAEAATREEIRNAI